MIEYSGAPFQYNPAVTNVNIDNQLTGILSQFNDDYIMDVVRDSINNKFRLYSTPKPNVVAAYEAKFKELTDGFSSNVSEIMGTRQRVYINIINMICDYYDFVFSDNDETDYYSVAYWLYDFLISNFTENLKNFYVLYLIREKDGIYNALNLSEVRKENDASLSYSKRLFKDPKLAAIHCNLEYVIDQISTFNIDLWTILNYVYQSNINLPSYIFSIISDRGNFFKNYYETFVIGSKDSAEILTYIKLSLQQLGGEIEPVI